MLIRFFLEVDAEFDCARHSELSCLVVRRFEHHLLDLENPSLLFPQIIKLEK